MNQLFRRDVSSPDEIERIADHIMHFSLKGLEHYIETPKERTRGEALFSAEAYSPKGVMVDEVF